MAPAPALLGNPNRRGGRPWPRNWLQLAREGEGAGGTGQPDSPQSCVMVWTEARRAAEGAVTGIIEQYRQKILSGLLVRDKLCSIEYLETLAGTGVG